MGVGAIALLAACGPEAPASDGTETEAESASDDTEAADAESAETPEAESEDKAADKAKVAVACGEGEQTIFSCTVKNGKTIAVCASDKGLDYRYGKDSAELTLSGGAWATVPYSGGGESQIKFSNSGTDYIVFSRIVRTNFEPGEPNNPAISDGVIVQSGDKVLNLQVCTPGEGGVDVDKLSRTGEPENELFSEATGRADPN